MTIYLDGEKDENGKHRDGKWLNEDYELDMIRAVEVFDEIVDVGDLFSSIVDVGDLFSSELVCEKQSLFLFALERESRIKFEKANGAALVWTLHLSEDGKLKEIGKYEPKLKIDIQARCPLLREDEDGLRIELKLESRTNPDLTTTLFFVKELTSNYRRLNKRYDLTTTVEQLLEREDVNEVHLDDLPSLLKFDNFAPGNRRPGGNSRWRVKLDRVISPGNADKYGISVQYKKEKTADGWWRNDEGRATLLYPLNIAPVGIYDRAAERKFDFEMKLKYPAKGPDIWLLGKDPREVTCLWNLEVHSVYDVSLYAPAGSTPRSFTPIAKWNELIAGPTLRSLDTVKDGNPASCIPRFLCDRTILPETAPVWTMLYTVADKRPFAGDNLKDEEFEYQLQDVSISDGKSLEMNVVLSNLTDTTELPIQRCLKLTKSTKTLITISRWEGAGDEGSVPVFRSDVQDVTHSGDERASCPIVRVGALNLHFGIRENELPPTGKMSARLIANYPKQENGRRKLFQRPEAKLEMRFLLAGISPGGQDPLPSEAAESDDRLPQTIIIPIVEVDPPPGNVPGLIDGPYALVVDEDSEPTEDHKLGFRLEKLNAAKQATRSRVNFIVLDSSPFLIARVDADIDFSGEVGNWDDRESFWELADTGGSFKFILPPPVVGEDFIRDYTSFKKPDGGIPDDDPFALRYKFSPPGIFNVLRSTERSNFTETPWNVRRLFGYIKGRERGSILEQAEYELLYGLTTNIKNDFLRLSELNGRLGHLPALFDVRKAPLRLRGKDASKDKFVDAYKSLCDRYTKQKGKLLGRFAMLYPFSVAHRERLLSLDEGVSFSFRPGRQICDPVPVIGIERPDFVPLNKGGLRGGVDWGFESKNIHDEVLVPGTSSSGRIAAPSFTALGGSGYQKASFAGNKRTIYSNTQVGRTFFYSIESIGRIGVLWNRAKHVIIYERSVADTKQFDDKLKTWIGVPVVRKVTEYVEILQPERNYPEFGEAPKSRGFVLGSKFEPEARIYVDSKWGRDIPGGWVVPLFNPAEARAKPEVYGPPNIHLKIATSDKTGKAQTWGRITDPEKLCFYTSTNPKDDDQTDKWTPVADIDFPADTPPKPPAGVETGVKGALDTMLPDPPRTEGGYENFTYHVDTNKQTGNLLCDRLDSPVEAVIENVSLVRRTRGSFEPGPASKRIRVSLTVNDVTFDRKIEKELIAPLTDLSSANLDKFLKLINGDGATKGYLKKIEEQVIAQGNKNVTILVEAQKALQEQWRQNWNTTAGKVAQELKAGVLVGEAQNILFRVIRQIAAAESALDETLLKAANAVDEIDRFLAGYDDFVNRLVLTLKTDAERVAVDGVLKEPELKLQRITASAVDLLTAWQNDLNDLRQKTKDAIPVFWKDFEGTEKTFTEIVDELTSLNNIAEIEVWLKRVETALLNEAGCKKWLNTLKSNLQTEITTINQKLAKARDDLNSEVNKAQDLLEKADRDKIVDYLSSQKLEGVRGKIETAFFKPAEDAVAEVESNLKAIQGDVESFAKNLEDEVAAVGDLAKVLASKVQNAASDEVRRALNSAAGVVLGNAAKVLAPIEQTLQKELQRLDASNLAKAAELGDQTLRLVRAFGEAPVAEALKLNRERLAYYFDDLKNSVDFTPATALMNRVGRELPNIDLKTLGIRLPSKELAEKFVADNLPKFDLKDIFPSFAGLDLSKLFSEVKIPKGVGDAVNVTHGLDKQTYRAWAKADVLVKMDRPIPLFDFGGVLIRVTKGVFEAHTSMSADVRNPGQTQKVSEGSILADWELVILGETVMTIENAVLRFDRNGRLNFEMKPSAIKLAKALDFVSDLVKKFKPGNKSGLSFEAVMDGQFPVGARAVLSLPLPPLQTGAFAISHLALRSMFEVSAKGGKFQLAAGLALSSKERPFTLTILCLGGGGWFDASVQYMPFEPPGHQLTSRASIGLAAGADFTFDIGVAAGTVYFLVSLYAEFNSGASNSFRIALRVSVGGEVTILCIASASISLVLEASYESGGRMLCRGQLTVSIEICWCFTLEVDQQVEFTLAGGSGNQELAGAGNDEVEKAVEDYVNSYA